ncbi:MAG: secondary thiamine-phosphate synthase enzyme YjbQ [Actinomycetota bacterium]|nr:secondary thiamine-phosphate synthase enzyme YjbQ [Actinomycetota bacterium]
MQTIKVKTSSRTDMKEITSEVSSVVKASKLEEGACLVFVAHTTAGITINENADPSVREDVASTLERMVPWAGPYRHAEGNSAAHIKASLVGQSTIVPIKSAHLMLGTWQGIFLCEFDGPRERLVHVVLLRA